MTIYTISGVLHVIQIVSKKKSMMIILFTQPSESRNFISLVSLLCKIPRLKKKIFHLDKFFEATGYPRLRKLLLLAF